MSEGSRNSSDVYQERGAVLTLSCLKFCIESLTVRGDLA